MITPNNKISLLVNEQFPDFVQEEYPLFVRFLEAYYEFLENKITLDQFIATQDQRVFKTKNSYTPNAIDVFLNGTKLAPGVEYDSSSGTEIKLATPASAGQILVVKSRNDLYARAKEMVNIKDVDESLTDFQNEFFNTYLSLFPKNTDASKYVLIKNASNLFKSKGNENSFKYFFRTLFNEEIEIYSPKNDILVASGGKYKISRVLRSNQNVYSDYKGGATEYEIAIPRISYPQDPFNGEDYQVFGESYRWDSSNNKWTDTSTTPVRDTISVYVNGALKTSNPVNIQWNLSNLKNSQKFFRTSSSNNGINLGDVRTVEFKSDGSVLYLLGPAIFGGSRIHQVPISTAWDLSTASTSSTFSPQIRLRRSDGTSTIMSTLIGFDFKPDGSKVFLTNAGASQNFIVEMNLTQAWNVQTIATESVVDAFFDVIKNRINNSISPPGTTQISIYDVKFKPDGTRMFISSALNFIDEYALSTAWQVNTANYTRSVITSSMIPTGAPALSSPQSILFKDDGTRLFITTTSSNSVFQFNLNEAWNIQSSSYVSHLEPQLGVSGYNLITANTNGTTFYIGIGRSAWATDTQRGLYQFNSEIDYYLDRERNKIVFPSKTDESSDIKVYYSNFDPNLLINRQIVGANSGARAIIESASIYKNSGQDIFEYELDQKSIFKTFLGNENYRTTILATDESSINVVLQPFSVLSKINILDGGSSYNVGDPVRIIGGSPIVEATANVSKVFSGNLNLITVNYGGAGFLPGPNVIGSGIIANIQEVDTSGANSANSYVYSDDMIWDLSGTLISNTNYKLNNAFTFSSITTPNVNSRIIDCLRYKTLTSIGPISKVLVLSSSITVDSPLPRLNAQSAFVSVNSYNNIVASRRPLNLIDFGSIGRIDIDSPGSNFSVGDGINIFYPSFGDVRFNPLSPTTKGTGARAFISKITSTGGIEQLELCPPRPAANTFIDYTRTGRVNLSVATATSYRVSGLNFEQVFANGKGSLITFNIGWDISNLKFQNEQFSRSLDLSQFNAGFNPRGFAISNTGHRIYVLDQNQNLFRQFNLNSNNNSRSAISSSQRIQSTGLTSQYGMKFSANGARLYVCNLTAPASLRQYNLSESWNVNTASLQTGTSILDVSALDTNPRDISFSEDGKTVAFMGNSRKIFQYRLGFPWELSSRANSVLSITPSSGAYSNSGNVFLTFTGGGTQYVQANARIFINSISNIIETVEIYNAGEYSAPVSVQALSAPAGLATFTVAMTNNLKESLALNPSNLVPSGLFVHPKGRTIFVANSTGIIYHYEMSELWDVATTNITPIQSIDITQSINNNFQTYSNAISFLSFTEDGSEMFVGSDSASGGRRVLEFDVSVPQTTIAPSTGITDTSMIVPRIGSAGLYIPRTLSLGFSTNNITYVRTRTYEDTRLIDNNLYKTSRVSIQQGNNQIQGIATNFRNDFKSGDQIIVYGQKRTVDQVISDSLMTVTSVFSVTKGETRQIGKYNTVPNGGMNYRMDDLPLAEVDIDSIGGGAQLAVTSIMGDGEDLTMASSKRRGEIEEILIINSGTGYSSTPEIFLNHIGDKNALASAETQNSFYFYPGYYLNSDGHLSGDKKLQDSIFYNSGTYIIKTKQQFEKFKTSLLNLIHPVGKKLYSEFIPSEITIQSTTTRTIIGSTITQEPV